MKRRFGPVASSFIIILATLLMTIASAERSDREKSREHRLPCNGVVSLYYGDELIWTKGPDKLRAMTELLEVPDERQSGIKGLQLSSLLALRPNVAAIELESCKPRLRRFARSDLESEAAAELYLVATNYRGFRLRNAARKRGGGGGLKNIGKIVLVPLAGSAAAEAKPDKESGKESGDKMGPRSGNGSGQGRGQQSGRESGKDSGQASDTKSDLEAGGE